MISARMNMKSKLPQPGPDFVVNTSADTDDGYCDVLGQGVGNQDCTAARSHRLPQITPMTRATSPSRRTTPSRWWAVNCRPITTAITITGNGAANTILQANANPNTARYRVFQVSSGGNLTLNNLTIRNGRLLRSLRHKY